jgi:hypothetical protein
MNDRRSTCCFQRLERDILEFGRLRQDGVVKQYVDGIPPCHAGLGHLLDGRQNYEVALDEKSIPTFGLDHRRGPHAHLRIVVDTGDGLSLMGK